MFYKLSNTAELTRVEDDFDAMFKYPLIYKKSHIINGLSEQSLPIITMEQPELVNYAIWGLLPQNFKEGWDSFQNITNTLNIAIEDINETHWVNTLLKNQRCVIIVTGFFTSFLYNGEVYPFYVYEKNRKPFALAGFYTRLNDGFLSVSLVTSAMENELTDVHNLGKSFPVALNSDHYKSWLNPYIGSIKDQMHTFERLELQAHTISKEFYKNDIVFEDILEPAHYGHLPFLSLK